MSRYTSAPEGKDPVIWDIAQRRASFKRHLLSFVIVNAFLWTLWFFSAQRHNVDFQNYDWANIPWPLWTTVCWGIGLAFHFAGAYVFPKANSTEREYEKLINKNNNTF